MNTSLSVENGKIVVRWGTGGFDHYNIRWTENGGAARQVERDGDKRFIVLPGSFRRGVVYSISVQGCESKFLGHSTCTSWEEADCGSPQEPCVGPYPQTIVNGGGLCLDVNAPDQQINGGRVQLWQCNKSDQQAWTFRDGQIVSLAGKCLDVDLSNLHKDGGRVQVWDCNRSVQQRWSSFGPGFLRNGGGKCLDANLSTIHQNGCVVQVWDCNGSTQQRWSRPH